MQRNNIVPLIYSILKDPKVSYRTFGVFKAVKDKETSCATCSKTIYYGPCDLFDKKLLGCCCSFDCLKKFDGGYIDKRTDALPPALNDEKDDEETVSTPVKEVVAKVKKEPLAAKAVKTEKSTGYVKKTCPKCGGSAKRGKGNAGKFNHNNNCAENDKK